MKYIVYDKTLQSKDLQKYNIFISADSKVAEGTKIWSNVCINSASIVCSGCEITSNSVLENAQIDANVCVKSSYLEDCKIGEGCTIGPFSHIRGNSVLGQECRVGNFVEIKNAQIGSFCKMAHLAYIGDATIGENCNIGCGVIFCNYNGKIKQRSTLGDNVFVGSNSNLIAPVTIESNVYIAGGSTITQDIKKDEFAIARSRQINKTDFKNPYIEGIKEKQNKK